jgi:hypothetical protein
MFINWRQREINLKIVYYGPALSGKTTNLQQIHARTNPKVRGDLVSLKTRGDRTLYFDFLQIELGRIAGLKPRFNLYTVPGQVYYANTRRLVLQGADGVVFVADSELSRFGKNLQAMRDLTKNLRTYGLDLHALPLVLQFNKRDLLRIAPLPAMKKALCVNGSPYFEAVATEGEGVFETMKAIINLVVRRAQKEI